MRAIDADAITYESIDSCDTGRHEHYYGTGIIAVRKEDIDAMPTIQSVNNSELPNSSDCISRQSAIEAIEAEKIAHGRYLTSSYTGYEFAKDVIRKLPPIQPEPHWIPVTKDTPKEAGTYMCTCYDAGRRIVTLVKWQPRTKTWNLTGARAYWKVIAWCKRPEPYKVVTE